MSKDEALLIYLSNQIQELVNACRRDGLENSLAHLNGIEERNRAVYALLIGEPPRLPL